MQIQGAPDRREEEVVHPYVDSIRRGTMKQLLAFQMCIRDSLNAVTRASQDVSDYQRATELERLGGEILAATKPLPALVPLRRPEREMLAL